MYTEKALFLPVHEVITDIVIYKSFREEGRTLLENLKNVEEIMFYPDKKAVGSGSNQIATYLFFITYIDSTFAIKYQLR